MSVFTVEPPINRNTGDYPTPLDKITVADRKIELQSYATRCGRCYWERHDGPEDRSAA